MICKNCGTQNADGGNFCEVCGARLVDDHDATESGNLNFPRTDGTDAQQQTTWQQERQSVPQSRPMGSRTEPVRLRAEQGKGIRMLISLILVLCALCYFVPCMDLGSEDDKENMSWHKVNMELIEQCNEMEDGLKELESSGYGEAGQLTTAVEKMSTLCYIIIGVSIGVHVALLLLGIFMAIGKSGLNCTATVSALFLLIFLLAKLLPTLLVSAANMLMSSMMSAFSPDAGSSAVGGPTIFGWISIVLSVIGIISICVYQNKHFEQKG